MFLFFHNEQTAQNTSYWKGKLFEELLARYLSAAGYRVQIRTKKNSLEYDLDGVHLVDGRRVLGEAKAHGRPITGETVASFVGKLVPQGLLEARVAGLFLSTSPLTAEADDYRRSLDRLPVSTYAGTDLLEQLQERLSLPKLATLEQQLRERQVHPLTSHLLVTDAGVYVAVLAASSASALASHFALFRENGQLLSDSSFSAALQKTVPELQALIPILDASRVTPSTARNIPLGVAVGSDWADYRLPAAPNLFIGRRPLAGEIQAHIESPDLPNVIQIKSRSGVGKSSFLAYLDSQFKQRDYRTELHDARDIKSVFDIFSVVQRFVAAPLPASDIRGVENQLRSAATTAVGPMIFMVDQFESTFTEPESYGAYETMATIFADLRPHMYLILARKNDQLTTYDDTRISLDRLASLSQSYSLGDFETSEAAELIEKISRTAAKRIGRDVKSYVLEFAQGFPWLIKRTMAHIVRLVRTGVAQGELFAAGLRLDELFDEELEGLDELERDYLTRIANGLPANFQQLQRSFDEDPLLPQILDKLTRHRLLRLSGSTYDTYNDVFKEYLIYQRLPEFRQAYIFHVAPTTILPFFHELARHRRITSDDICTKMSLSLGTVFNQVRELRNLGLLKKDADHWVVPQAVLDICDRGRLGEFVRRSILDNAVVSDLLAQISKHGSFRADDVLGHLRRSFPFIEASEKTWAVYASMTRSWLELLGLVEIANDVLSIPQGTRAEIVQNLGNLTELKSRRATGGAYLPTVQWKFVDATARKLLQKRTPNGVQESKAVADLRALELLDDDHPVFKNISTLRSHVTTRLQAEPYARIWGAALKGTSLLEALTSFTGSDMAEATRRWRLKILLNWGRELGLIAKRSYRYE